MVCYFLAYGIAKPLAAALLNLATKSVKENIAMLVGAAFFVVFNYFGQRFVVFKRQNKDKN
jgi:putative flippase GtrA